MAALKWLRIVFLKNAKGCAELGCDAEHARWTERRHHVSTGQIEDSYLCDEHAAQRRDESKRNDSLDLSAVRVLASQSRPAATT